MSPELVRRVPRESWPAKPRTRPEDAVEAEDGRREPSFSRGRGSRRRTVPKREAKETGWSILPPAGEGEDCQRRRAAKWNDAPGELSKSEGSRNDRMTSQSSRLKTDSAERHARLKENRRRKIRICRARRRRRRYSRRNFPRPCRISGEKSDRRTTGRKR